MRMKTEWDRYNSGDVNYRLSESLSRLLRAVDPGIGIELRVLRDKEAHVHSQDFRTLPAGITLQECELAARVHERILTDPGLSEYRQGVLLQHYHENFHKQGILSEREAEMRAAQKVSDPQLAYASYFAIESLLRPMACMEVEVKDKVVRWYDNESLDQDVLYTEIEGYSNIRNASPFSLAWWEQVSALSSTSSKRLMEQILPVNVDAKQRIGYRSGNLGAHSRKGTRQIRDRHRGL